MESLLSGSQLFIMEKYMSEEKEFKSPLVSCIRCREVKSARGIFSHFIKTHTVEGAERAKLAGKLAAPKYKQYCVSKRSKVVSAYADHPARCSQCNSPLIYDKRKNKFCNQSCSAVNSNKLRPAGHASRKLGNDSRRESAILNNSGRAKQPKPVKVEKPLYTKIAQCCACNKFFPGSSKSCSLSCRSILMSANKSNAGIKKNCIEYNGVKLGSSYELTVAQSMDANNIKWIKPKGLRYIDPTGKPRTYYPDFYLPEYDIYLDPKNDFLINNPNPYHGFMDCDKIKWAETFNVVRVLILNIHQLDWTVFKNLI
jgi:hypothetical protein